jgi:uncharacterized protein (DUF58 family)
MTTMQPGRRYLEPSALARLANMNLVARAVVEGFISGLHRSPFHGFSVEFSEYREYVPGDDLKHFDWKAYARSDRHYIKQYQEETNLRAYVLLDASNSMKYSSEGLTKFQYGCYLAASLAYLLVRQQDSVGLAIFDEAMRTFLSPRNGFQHMRNLVGMLEQAKPGGRTRVSATFHHLAETIKKRGLVIVISDLLDDAEAVKKGLRHFRHKHHEVIVFHLFDPAELRFPFRGLSDFRDMETGERLQIDPAYYRKEYLEKLRGLINRYRRDCSESRIDYVVAETSRPFDLLLAQYLTKRARLG